MLQRALTVSGGGGGATLLWENSTNKLSAQTLTIPNLDNYDVILFYMYDETDYGSDNLAYTGMALSDLATEKAVGWTSKQPNYTYSAYRLVTHSGTNQLTISTGHYYRAGSSDSTSTGYGVPMKIYGIKL